MESVRAKRDADQTRDGARDHLQSVFGADLPGRVPQSRQRIDRAARASPGLAGAGPSGGPTSPSNATGRRPRRIGCRGGPGRSARDARRTAAIAVHLSRVPGESAIEAGVGPGANQTLARRSTRTAAAGGLPDTALRGDVAIPREGISLEIMFDEGGCLRATDDAPAGRNAPPHVWIGRLAAAASRGYGGKDFGRGRPGWRVPENWRRASACRRIESGFSNGRANWPAQLGSLAAIMGIRTRRGADVPRGTPWWRMKAPGLPLFHVKQYVMARASRRHAAVVGIANASQPPGRFAPNRVCRMITLRLRAPPRSNN